MSLGDFFKSKSFFVHLGLSILATLLVVWIATKFLGVFTHHGDEITVPNLTGLKMEDLEEYVNEKDLEYEIVDSIYDLKAKKGTVISQDPFPNSKVKKGRTIYVTVVASQMEKTTVPDLKDLTLRQAMAVLETYGLKVGKLSYIPDIAKNAVLKQLVNGREIETGKMVEKGSTIDLVLGKGENEENTTVPFLLGKTHEEAIKLINEYSLNVGNEVYEGGADSTNGRVYKQSPTVSKKSTVSMGSSVKLWYKSEKKFDFKAFLKKHKNDTISDEEE